MYYPEEFIEKCKREYPDYQRLHELLDTGHVFAGRYLEDSSSTSIPFQTILKSNSLDELKEIAKR